MGDNTINSSATTVNRVQPPVQTTPAQQAQPAAAPAQAPAPQQASDQASVAQAGSSATSVSLVDGPQQAAPVEGPAKGPFEYNDRAVSLFNQFAASGKVYSGRVPTLDARAASTFSTELLTKISLAKGGNPEAVASQLEHADPIKTLQQVVGARVDGRFGPETLYKTVQLVQSEIQQADTPEKLAQMKQVLTAFGGKVRGLDDMLAAQTLRVGQTLISGAGTLEQLQQVEQRLQPLAQGNSTLAGMISTKRTAITAETERAAAAERARAEAERAAAAQRDAEAARHAQEAAEQATKQTKLQERQNAIDAAMTPVKDSSKDDDTARHLVSKGYNKDATTSQKVTLINSMLDGFTGDDDEKAIIQILKDDIGSGKINETLTALKKDRVNQLFDDIDGAENDQLLGTLFTASNISADHLKTFTAHMVSAGYDSKLVDLAKGKRGQLSDVAAPIVLNNLLKCSPSGKDEAVRALRQRIGMEGLLMGKVDMSRLYGHMGKDKEKAQFVVDILKGADALQAKINACPADKADERKTLTEARDYALNQAKAAIANADDDQTVEFMKLMVGPSDKTHSLRSFANLPEPLLNQLHKNLDSFWNNTWKTDEEKQYRQLIEDALAVKRRQAFGSDGDASAVPGSNANGYAPAATATAAPAAPAAPPATAAPAAPPATAAPAAQAAPPAAAPAADAVPGAAASAARPRSPNND
jgi:hypothetical protein